MRRTALMFVLAGLVGALVATPAAVYASHRLTDAPDSNRLLQSSQVLAGSVQRDASDFTGDITGVVWTGLNYVVEFANVELGECSGVVTPGVNPDTASEFSVSLPSMILKRGAASSSHVAVSFRDSNDFSVTQTAFHIVIVCP